MAGRDTFRFVSVYFKATILLRYVLEDMLLKDNEEDRALHSIERTQNKSKKNKSADINEDSSVTGREGSFIEEEDDRTRSSSVKVQREVFASPVPLKSKPAPSPSSTKKKKEIVLQQKDNSCSPPSSFIIKAIV